MEVGYSTSMDDRGLLDDSQERPLGFGIAVAAQHQGAVLVGGSQVTEVGRNGRRLARFGPHPAPLTKEKKTMTATDLYHPQIGVKP